MAKGRRTMPWIASAVDPHSFIDQFRVARQIHRATIDVSFHFLRLSLAQRAFVRSVPFIPARNADGVRAKRGNKNLLRLLILMEPLCIRSQRLYQGVFAMTTQVREVADEVVELCRRGKNLDAIDR